MDLNLWENSKDILYSFCPLIGMTNWKRRQSDNGKNPFIEWAGRLAASIIVSLIIGLSAGLLSSYIMVQVMEVKVDSNSHQIEKLESRLNFFLDRK